MGEIASGQIIFSDEGFNGLGISLGPWVGSSVAISNTEDCTLEDMAKFLVNGIYDELSLNF